MNIRFFQKSLLIIFTFYWFIFGHGGSSFLHRLISSCGEPGLLSSCAQASHCGGFSCGAQALEHAGLRSCGSHALEHRVSSCGGWVKLLHGVWGFLGSGIKPVSSALARDFFTTAPPGKPSLLVFELFLFWYSGNTAVVVRMCVRDETGHRVSWKR